MLTNYAVAVLSYNHPELTSKTVNSVLLRSNATVFLIHNGSDLKNINLLQSQLPRVTHLIQNENKGFSGGANFGLNEIFKVFENVLFLTNDTELISVPNEFPQDLDIFSISIMKRNSELIDSIAGRIDLRTGKLSHLKTWPVQLSPNEKMYIPGTAFGICKTVFTKLGGFDESLHTYWEDVELSLRALADSQLRVGVSELFKVKHKIGKTCHKHRFYTLYLFQRNRKRILKKYGINRIIFLSHYLLDMTQLFFRIILRPNSKPNLQLWWKAIYD